MSFTSDRAFLDTNVIAWLFDNAATKKETIARELLQHAARNDYWISSQVIFELCAVAQKKTVRPLPREMLSELLTHLSQNLHTIDNTARDAQDALKIQQRHQISF